MDPRRAVPRTDTVLADPRLADATARLGRERVKAAVASAQQAVREGALAATEVGNNEQVGGPETQLRFTELV